MRLRNEIFANVLDWLVQEGKVHDQKDLAIKIGVSQNAISRIMTDKVEPKDDTLRKLNQAFGNIFNMQYLRGESTTMLIEDEMYYRMHPEDHPLRKLAKNQYEERIDQSSLINAALASRDQTIDQLELRIADKNKYVEQLELRIAERNKYVELLEKRVEELEAANKFLSETHFEEKWPFPRGVADERKKKIDAHV